MTIDIVKRAGLFVVLCLIQALVLNHVNLFGCATPLLYVYMVIGYPHNISRASAMLWAFCLGMAVDACSNTPGMATAALTLVAALQPGFFGLFLSHDAPEELKPSSRAMGFGSYSFYVLTLVLLHCTVFFTLEAFSFFNWQLWLKNIIGSTLLTVVIILTLERFGKR